MCLRFKQLIGIGVYEEVLSSNSKQLHYLKNDNQRERKKYLEFVREESIIGTKFLGSIKDNVIEKVSSFSYLGVWITYNGSWKLHKQDNKR